MAIYFVFYFSTLGLFCVSIDKYFKSVGNQILFFFLCFSTMLFLGLRHGIAGDYWNYYDLFYEKGNLERLEPGWLFLVWLYKNLFSGNSFNGFIFFISVLSIGIKYFYFKKLANPYFALLIYLSIYFIGYEFSGMRQGLAIGLVFHAVDYARRKKVWLFLISTLLATTIHYSSIIYFPLYFIIASNKSLHIARLAFYAILMLIIRVFFLNYIFEAVFSLFSGKLPVIVHYKYYFFSVKNIEFSLGVLRRVLVMLFFFMMNKTVKVNNCYLKLYSISLLIYILLIGNDNLTHRLSIVFDVFSIPLFAGLKIQYDKRKFIILMIFTAMQFTSYVSYLKPGYTIPYRTYLNQ